MKLKKVAAICDKSGTFKLLDQVDENGEFICQWLGDAAAFYPKPEWEKFIEQRFERTE